ncbi:hypothetical protein E5A73_14790 [Sphingomonas gei]|uniref:Uncharacterized protein n=1 Tax=Sphingomonas gei TaxID=1395960 RepID=A0A4S1XD89_9SPHN|nr:hypothetical protein [Sphingomonas gei]TGX52886.1 hypothetical protein E5A73_14790 [Sphingomonas gei]
MNAQTAILPADDTDDIGFEAPRPIDYAAFHGFSPGGAARYEGWTPDKQRTFLEALSEGHTVVQAAAIVGLSKQSAYALRQSPRGQSFALGWQAAVLLARNALADELMERAFKGTRETLTRNDGSIVTRHRHDNRLAMAMLNRLDRMASQAEPAAAAARLIATDFAQYLELIGRDAGPARAGVFLGARVEPAGNDDLAPIRALARADKWLRTHTDIAEPVVTADLDPAERATWNGEQWNRAEAAGLVKLAPENPVSSQASQPPITDRSLPVWWDEIADEWRTCFPPPEDFDREEDGEYGDGDYARALSRDEEAALVAVDDRVIARQRRVEWARRDAWLAALAQEAAALDAEDAAESAAPDPDIPAPDL